MKKPDSSDGLMTVPQVTKLLHIHANTLRRWSDRGLIRSYRVGNRGDRRFSREDVERFLSEYNAENRPTVEFNV
jgi:excisionase family DNA binding protein